MLTDSRFWIGVGVGAAFVYFALPMLRGTLAARQAGNAGR
jgi:hypothetical protein